MYFSRRINLSSIYLHHWNSFSAYLLKSRLCMLTQVTDDATRDKVTLRVKMLLVNVSVPEYGLMHFFGYESLRLFRYMIWLAWGYVLGHISLGTLIHPVCNFLININIIVFLRLDYLCLTPWSSIWPSYHVKRVEKLKRAHQPSQTASYHVWISPSQEKTKRKNLKTFRCRISKFVFWRLSRSESSRRVHHPVAVKAGHRWNFTKFVVRPAILHLVFTIMNWSDRYLEDALFKSLDSSVTPCGIRKRKLV